MDHVVYLDARAEEMESLLSGEKTMIIRGAAGRKMPYGTVNAGDTLFFINNNAEGVIKGKASVKGVFNSQKMAKQESIALVQSHQDELQLTEKQFKRWAGKRYIVLIRVAEVEGLAPFRLDKSNFGNMDDWLPVGSIEDVRL
jgi:hypothetical protein